jgi:hypothetical protein
MIDVVSKVRMYAKGHYTSLLCGLSLCSMLQIFTIFAPAHDI